MVEECDDVLGKDCLDEAQEFLTNDQVDKKVEESQQPRNSNSNC